MSCVSAMARIAESQPTPALEFFSAANLNHSDVSISLAASSSRHRRPKLLIIGKRNRRPAPGPEGEINTVPLQQPKDRIGTAPPRGRSPLSALPSPTRTRHPVPYRRCIPAGSENSLYCNHPCLLASPITLINVYNLAKRLAPSAAAAREDQGGRTIRWNNRSFLKRWPMVTNALDRTKQS